MRPSLLRTDLSPDIWVTWTRVNDWYLEAPCGWHERFGAWYPYADVKQIARLHKASCDDTRCQHAKITDEVPHKHVLTAAKIA